MNIQSFSIVVPNNECINKCPFCVSRMVNSNIYPNLMDISHPTYDYNVKEYMRRMKYVADNGCQTLMLTGTSEPQQNKQFLNTFALLHEIIGKPFTNIEMQTTGKLLDNPNYLRFLKNFVCINTIALSISSPCDSENNYLLNGCQDTSIRGKVDLEKLTSMLKDYGFNIRLCFNLSNYYKFDDTEQSKWIKTNKLPSKQIKNLAKYLKTFEPINETLYGAAIRYINGMSVIFDDDCMGKNPTRSAMKYLILRPNCKLYSSWDDPASLVF